jgi:D-3-phosphoglycerate dehydrogenase
VPTTVLVTDYAWPSLDVERRILAGVGAEVVVATMGDERELVALAPGADAILTNWKPVTARVLDAASRCTTVARYGVGVDNIDVARATELGIVVSNVPDYCIDEVSDHAIALMLALARRIVDFAAQTRAGGWDNQAFGPLHRLRDRTLGLIGFGRIARLVAPKARAFGLGILAYAPSLSPGAHHGVEATASLDELLARSDLVSLHAPLTPATHHLLGPEELARMRPGALLVNTARGGLLDLEAVRAALSDGRLGGVGLDVLDEEPPPPDDPIRGVPGVVLTPHAAFYSVESVVELQKKASANVVSALGGTAPETTVNPDVLGSPSLRLARDT